MEEIRYEVQGSAEAPYAVTFKNHGNGNLTAHCTCPAGLLGQYCKHRMNILVGDITAIVSGNESTVSIVHEWFVGSDVEKALKEIERLEAAMDTLKKQLSGAKKALSRAMTD